MRKVIVAIVAAAGACLLSGMSAVADTATGPIGQQLSVTPSSVVPGSTVTVSGRLPSCPSVTLLSRAFPGPAEFAGVPAVTAAVASDGSFSTTVTIPTSRAPGAYDISGRACGGNLGVVVTLHVHVAVPSTGAGQMPSGSSALLVAAGILIVLIAAASTRHSPGEE